MKNFWQKVVPAVSLAGVLATPLMAPPHPVDQQQICQQKAVVKATKKCALTTSKQIKICLAKIFEKEFIQCQKSE